MSRSGDTLSYIRSIIQTPEIRDRIFYSIAIMAIFRLLAAIPVVGIPADAISQLFAGNNFGQTISTVSGGVLETASVVAIGLGPYINASIILQLLGPVFPKLEEMRKEGSQGRRKISMYTRYLSVPLAIMQSFVIYSTLRGFGLIGEVEPLALAAMIATLTAGATLMMWLGELIAESGLGQGSSYIISLGILAGFPAVIQANLQTSDLLEAVVFLLIMVILVAVVVLITQSERRIPIVYSRRVRGGVQAADNYLPIKLTHFGVLPVIFAVAFLSFPQLVAQFLVSREINATVTEVSSEIIRVLGDPLVADIATFLLVILFSFFYITISFNADEHAENLQKQGAFIQGIRPGAQTASYLRKVAFRLTAVGALILAVLAVLPNALVVSGIVNATILSGTSLLIVVGSALDIRRQIASLVVVRGYDRYLR